MGSLTGGASAADADRVAELDELTTRVLAPNPSPMTLDGTNTYLVGAPEAGELVCIDPGPRDPEHRERIERAAAARDAAIVAVVVTHHHLDHAEAAGWASEWGVATHAFAPRMIAEQARGVAAEAVRGLRDGDVLEVAGIGIEAVHTPGHASDHLCVRVRESGAVCSGDHVLGRGTSVVAWPDGDLAAYLDALRRLREVDAPALFPGHGPVVDDPRGKIDEYLAHRLDRERQVLDALRRGAATPREIVGVVYADVDPALHPAAERTVQAHLDKLVAEGRVPRDPGVPRRDEEADDGG